jgi:hypothetical protein
MFGLGELSTVLGVLRDASYDTVFHAGDTALQFTGDLIRGPDYGRSERYAHRQIDRSERQAARKAEATLAHQTAKARAQSARSALRYEEKKTFAKMMQREKGESIVEHWKRQKALLAAPDKRQLVQHYERFQAKLDTTQKAHDRAKLEAEFRQVARASAAQSQTQGQKQGQKI